jgi:hypothetical protein
VSGTVEEPNDSRERIPVKYMLLIYANRETWAGFGPEDWSKAIAEQDAFNKEFFDSGELLGAYGLADVVNTKVVRVRDGVPAVTDGPYVEAKEHLASSYVLDCDSEARALEIAARMPFASFRGVEVWPIMHDSAPEI